MQADHRMLPAARRWPVAVAAALAAAVVAGCTVPGEGAAPPATSSQASTSAATNSVPVYYVADTGAGPRLYREFHAVPAAAEPASAAVRELLGAAPVDRDYRTLWPAGATLRAPVAREGATVVVDLAGVGGGPTDPATATLALQQLVFTVQGALQVTDPVRVLVDGAAVPRLWDAVDTGAPIARADQTAVRSLVQIDSPADGATVGRDVVVSGEAAVFEATLPWEVRRGGAVVRSGVAMTAQGQRFSAYTFTVTLEPGDYEVVVTEDDPSGGQGRPPFTDSKRIVVRG